MAYVKYPIGIQSFQEIIIGNYIYVDKTERIFQMINRGKYYFLSRPRRFGKSLLLSTLKAYFEGKRELFEGLAIADMENDWVKCPVLMLSFSAYNPSAGDLTEIIDNQLSEYESTYDIPESTENLGMRFRNLILEAERKTGQKVVILIDEYDSPIMAHLHEEERYEEVKNMLKSVYVNLKDMDEHIKFGMLTGVTRFSKMTIFSGLNNLNDISLDDRYSDICGITEEELDHYFKEGISDLAKKLKCDDECAKKALKENYDGYHFSGECPDIYNPFSLLCCLNKSKIESYWFQTATPTFLIKEMERLNVFLPEILNEAASATTLADIDTYRTSPIALLFQTGYLTIKDYEDEYDMYTLGVPNREVEKGLFRELLASLADSDSNEVDKTIYNIRKSFNTGNPQSALKATQVFLAGIPANLTQKKPEVYFENNLYLLFKLAGLEVNTEWWTSDGRIDMLLRTPGYIYVIELKLDKSAQEALNQIDSKNYTLQFHPDGRRIVKIGINFSSDTRTLSDWIIQNQDNIK